MNEEGIKALLKAYYFGQTYWQQANSDSLSRNKKSVETETRFESLVEEMKLLFAAADNEHDALKARVAELEAARRWQDIETLPLDKEVLLLIGRRLVDIGCKRSYGWAVLRGRGYVDASDDHIPTHWMPLPEAPK